MALVKCKECGNQISKSAKACPQCGAKQKKQVGVLGWLFALFVVLPVAWHLGSGSPGQGNQSTSAPAATSSKPDQPPPKPEPNWSSSEYADAMTDEKTAILFAKSTNASDFPFPYSKPGGSKLILTFRKSGQELDAYIRIEKGQMQCSSLDCSFNLRIGDGAVQKWTGLPTTTNDRDMMFVRDAAKLEQIVKTGQKIRIGVEFFQQGQHAFDFDTSGYPGF